MSIEAVGAAKVPTQGRTEIQERPADNGTGKTTQRQWGYIRYLRGYTPMSPAAGMMVYQLKGSIDMWLRRAQSHGCEL
jgi:hypothetical protein